MKANPMRQSSKNKLFKPAYHTCRMLLLGAGAMVMANSIQAKDSWEVDFESEAVLPDYAWLNKPFTFNSSVANKVHITQSSSSLLVYKEDKMKAEAVEIKDPKSTLDQVVLNGLNLTLYPTVHYQFSDEDGKSVSVLVAPLSGGYSDFYTARLKAYREEEHKKLATVYKEDTPQYHPFAKSNTARFELAIMDSKLPAPSLENVKEAFSCVPRLYSVLESFSKAVRSIASIASGNKLGCVYAPRNFEGASQMAYPTNFDVRAAGMVKVIKKHEAPFLMCPRASPSEVKAIKEALAKEGLVLTLIAASRKGELFKETEAAKFYSSSDDGPFASDIFFKVEEYCAKVGVSDIKVRDISETSVSDGYKNSETNVMNNTRPIAITMSGCNIDLISALSPPPEYQKQHIAYIEKLSDISLKENKSPIVAFFTQKNASDLVNTYKIKSKTPSVNVYPIPYLGRADGDPFSLHYYFMLQMLQSSHSSSS